MPITEKRTVIFCIVESPYAPFTKNDPKRAAVELARNEAYVNACMADAFARGEVPFASHGIYTRNTHGVKVLDDTIPEERKKGMQGGFDVAAALSMLAAAHETANPIIRELSPFKNVRFVRGFYVDRGWTSGMADGMLEAGKNDQKTEKRQLGGEWSRDNDDDYMLDANGRLYKWRNLSASEQAAAEAPVPEAQTP